MSGVGGINSGPQPIRQLDIGSVEQRAPRRTGDSGAPPPPRFSHIPEEIPVLAPPTQELDALGDIANKFLSLKLKVQDQQLSGSIKDIHSKGVEMKTKNEEISKKLNDAAEKAAQAEKSSLWMKIFGWIAVALSVIAAVVTGGALAIVSAGIAVAMATLNETGVMNKLTEAIAKSLEDGGMGSETAKKWAMGIVTALGLAVSLATVGAGFASGTQAVANLASKFPKLAELGTKIGTAMGDAVTTVTKLTVESAMKIGTLAKVVGAGATISQGAAGVAGGVQRFEAANLQADTVEMRAFLRRLQQKMEEEGDLVQQLMQQMSDAVGKVIDMMGDQIDTTTNVIRNMRPQTG